MDVVRHVLIVRHAKSDWADWTLADHDRPLASRGVKALPRLRAHLADCPPPDLVLCSSAQRTIETLAGIREALPVDVEVEVDSSLYGAGSAALLERLQLLDEDVRTVMLVGHNPGAHELAFGLAGEGNDDQLHQLATKYPTGAIATLAFDGPWDELGPSRGRLVDMFTPRGSER